MTNTIKWKYEGTDIFFISTPETFERHKLQNARHLNLENPTPIIIENGTTITPLISSAPCRNCNASTKAKPTLSVDAKTSETTEQETTGLPNVSDVLDSSTSAGFLLEDDSDLSLA